MELPEIKINTETYNVIDSNMNIFFYDTYDISPYLSNPNNDYHSLLGNVVVHSDYEIPLYFYLGDRLQLKVSVSKYNPLRCKMHFDKVEVARVNTSEILYFSFSGSKVSQPSNQPSFFGQNEVPIDLVRIAFSTNYQVPEDTKIYLRTYSPVRKALLESGFTQTVDLVWSRFAKNNGLNTVIYDDVKYLPEPYEYAIVKGPDLDVNNIIHRFVVNSHFANIVHSV